jgi:hypothetical protein
MEAALGLGEQREQQINSTPAPLIHSSYASRKN